jgi:hypothetical protein
VSGDTRPRAASATESHSGGRRDEKGERIQRIHTPIEIWRRLAILWPEGVACDPCSSPEALHHPPIHCYPEHENPKRRDGISFAWPDRSFFNPPWGDLRLWLGHAQGCGESVGLIPVRIRRHWFRHFMGSTLAHVMLDRLSFAGQQNAYPGDVAIVYLRGTPEIAASRFRDAFGDLGGYHLGALHYTDTRDAQASLF